MTWLDDNLTMSDVDRGSGPEGTDVAVWAGMRRRADIVARTFEVDNDGECLTTAEAALILGVIARRLFRSRNIDLNCRIRRIKVNAADYL